MKITITDLYGNIKMPLHEFLLETHVAQPKSSQNEVLVSHDQWLFEMGLYDTLSLFPEYKNKSYISTISDRCLIIFKFDNNLEHLWQ